MYALPEVEWATRAFWARIVRGVRERGYSVPLPDEPDRLHGVEAALRQGSLVFGQTCGFPLTHTLVDRVRLLGTPVYDAPGCNGPYYRSLVVVRADSDLRALADLRGRTVAVNGWNSQSGWNALAAMVAPLAEDGRFFARAVVTGTHARSLDAVRLGRADCAAIDCVTFALLHRHRPAALGGVRMVAETAVAPGLPFVTGPDIPPQIAFAVKGALVDAMTDDGLAEARGELLLTWVEDLPLSSYDVILDMERVAIPRPPT